MFQTGNNDAESKICKLHRKYCLVIWSAWFLEILLIVIYKVTAFQLIFDITVVPLNRLLATFSFLPIEPVLFVLEIVALKKKNANKKQYTNAVVFFILNAFFWIIYIMLFIWVSMRQV